MNTEIETAHIQRLIEGGLKTDVFLVRGTKLDGVIIGQDDTVICTVGDKGECMVYKHAIACIANVAPNRDYGNPDNNGDNS